MHGEDESNSRVKRPPQSMFSATLFCSAMIEMQLIHNRSMPINFEFDKNGR